MKIYRIKHKQSFFYATRDLDCFRPLTNDTKNALQLPLDECELLPVVNPSKIICIGLNYVSHAKELNMDLPEEPMFFLKPPTSIVGDNDPIIAPKISTQVDYEGELAVVIGQTCKQVSPSDIDKYIFGYTCANDVTARDFQRKDTLFTRAKGFDTFAPVGPCIETNLDLRDVSIKTILNDKVVQHGTTSDMIYQPKDLVSFVSNYMTLAPGDIILTGTPPGVGSLKHGDTVQIQIDGIGTLTNTIQNELC